jgi:hypothetical protein
MLHPVARIQRQARRRRAALPYSLEKRFSRQMRQTIATKT